MKYEFLEHTADIKIRSYGRTQEEAFESMVLAISEYLSKGEKIKSKIGKKIEVHGTDLENLLYNFLDELIYLLDAENFIVAKAEVKFLGNNIKATLYGDRSKNYKDLDHIKAPTYAEMHVKKTQSGWELQVVMDI